MNYAALLAMLAAISFTLPFLVALAEDAGIPRGYSIVTTLAAVVFALGWVLIRYRINRRQRIEARIEKIQERRSASPCNPESYLLHGDHLGDLLLSLGRKEDALKAFESYQQAVSQAGGDTANIRHAVRELERELGYPHQEDAHASL